MTDPFILPPHCWFKHTAAFSSASSAPPCNWATAFFSPDLVFLRRDQPLHKLEGHVKVPPCLKEARSVFCEECEVFPVSFILIIHTCLWKNKVYVTQHLHPLWEGCVWPFVQESKSLFVRLWLTLFYCGLFLVWIIIKIELFLFLAPEFCLLRGMKVSRSVESQSKRVQDSSNTYYTIL